MAVWRQNLASEEWCFPYTILFEREVRIILSRFSVNRGIVLNCVLFPEVVLVWWVDLGQLPHAHQAALSPSIFSRTGEENKSKKIMGNVKAVK